LPKGKGPTLKERKKKYPRRKALRKPAPLDDGLAFRKRGLRQRREDVTSFGKREADFEEGLSAAARGEKGED